MQLFESVLPRGKVLWAIELDHIETASYRIPNIIYCSFGFGLGELLQMGSSPILQNPIVVIFLKI